MLHENQEHEDLTNKIVTILENQEHEHLTNKIVIILVSILLGGLAAALTMLSPAR
ncbi:MAG TPA: hypothetical protein VN843_33015 [Anaerolineales bacterium]|nr:hypothetical protein [Anaerolineales bacterium]